MQETVQSASAPSQGTSILSSKVQRALEVRTDTPAMSAALDALAHLPSSHDMDSRSVRVAIEQDALQQALLLQGELQRLLQTVQTLRQGVSDAAKIAHAVDAAVRTNVLTPRLETMVAQLDPDSQDDVESSIPTTPSAQQHTQQQLSPEEALEQEEQLAALLADAFQQRQEAAVRAQTVHAFLEKFDLSQEHALLLDQYNFEDVHSDGTVHSTTGFQGMQFLEALDRVRAIRQQLTRTFGPTATSMTTDDNTWLHTSTSSSNDAKKLGATSAVRMMEALAQKQERAYERLYHWLHSYLHLNTVSHVPTSSGAGSAVPPSDMDAEAMDEALTHPFVRQALRTLRFVPAFYSHTLELIANARRGEETRRFLLALSSGYDGRPPIEMKAHDPVNYVGDMLAFAFQACSVEADVAKGVTSCGPDEMKGNAATARTSEESTEDDLDAFGDASASKASMSPADMLAHAMSGIARPLKHRVVQVIAALARKQDDAMEDDATVMLDDTEEGAAARSRVSSLYSIAGLLLFYRSAVEKAVHKLATENGRNAPDNSLVSAIGDCLNEAREGYVASLRVYSAMLESVTLMTGESEASLAQAMTVQIVRVRTGSPGFSADVSCPADLQVPLSLEFLVEMLLEAALSSCHTLDHTVTLKVTLATASKAGLQTSVASKLDGMICEKEQGMIDELVEKETAAVLDLCGLGSMSIAWKSMLDVEGIAMATHSDLMPDEVESSMKEFYASLYSPPLPSFEHIKDPVLRKLAKSKIADTVCHTYNELYTAMHSDKGGYDDLSFLQYTPEQVKTLFSV